MPTTSRSSSRAMAQTAPVTSAPPVTADDAHAGSDEPPLSLDIDVVHDGGDWEMVAGAEALVRAAAAAVASELGSRTHRSVRRAVGRRASRRAQWQLSRQTGTDERAYPSLPAQLPGRHDEPHFLGDIVLASETLQREAADLDCRSSIICNISSCTDCCTFLGYDHETDEEAQAMESLEVRILAAPRHRRSLCNGRRARSILLSKRVERTKS